MKKKEKAKKKRKEIATATPTFISQHPAQLAALNIKARPSTSKRITTC